MGQQIGLLCHSINTVQEFEHAAGRLSRADLIHLRAWLDDKIEDDLVVRDEVIHAIAQARGEIATGKATARKVLYFFQQRLPES